MSWNEPPKPEEVETCQGEPPKLNSKEQELLEKLFSDAFDALNETMETITEINDNDARKIVFTCLFMATHVYTVSGLRGHSEGIGIDYIGATLKLISEFQYEAMQEAEGE